MFPIFNPKRFNPKKGGFMEEYDVVIIGAGPAGLTAGIYAGREGLKAVILEKALKGGMANAAPMVLNFLDSSP